MEITKDLCGNELFVKTNVWGDCLQFWEDEVDFDHHLVNNHSEVFTVVGRVFLILRRVAPEWIRPVLSLWFPILADPAADAGPLLPDGHTSPLMKTMTDDMVGELLENMETSAVVQYQLNPDSDVKEKVRKEKAYVKAVTSSIKRAAKLKTVAAKAAAKLVTTKGKSRKRAGPNAAVPKVQKKKQWRLLRLTHCKICKRRNKPWRRKQMKPFAITMPWSGCGCVHS